MYLEACLQKRWHFSPFVSSVDGLLGVEATATLKRIASLLATKWRQPYSKTCGYVKSRVPITLVRATHRCSHGSCVPAHWISMQQPQWEDGAGLNHFRWRPQLSIHTPLPLHTTPPIPNPDTNQQTHWTGENFTPKTQKKAGSVDGTWVAEEVKGEQGTPVPPWVRPTISQYKHNKLF